MVAITNDRLYPTILNIRDQVVGDLMKEAEKVRDTIASSKHPNAEIIKLANKGFTTFQDRVHVACGGAACQQLVNSFIDSCKTYFYAPNQLQKEIAIIVLNKE